MKFLLILICVVSSPYFVFASDFNRTLFLKVREAKIKIEPSFLAKSITGLKYGDPVIVLDDTNSWFKIKSLAGKVGYLHGSMLSSSSVKLNSKSKFIPKSASSKDGVVMAGKGFNKEVERKYAKLNSSLNYKAVDRMEKISISDSQINEFVKAGKLVSK